MVNDDIVVMVINGMFSVDALRIQNTSFAYLCVSQQTQ